MSLFDKPREERLAKVYADLEKPKLTGAQLFTVLILSFVTFAVGVKTTNYLYNSVAPLLGLAQQGYAATMLISLAIAYLTNPRTIEEMVEASEQRKKKTFEERLTISLCGLVYFGITAGLVAILT